jgi:hypothetical protein
MNATSIFLAAAAAPASSAVVSADGVLPDAALAVFGDTLMLVALVVAGALVSGRLRPGLAAQTAASLIVGLGVLVASGAAFLAFAVTAMPAMPALVIAGIAGVVTAVAFTARGGSNGETRFVAMQALVAAPVAASLSVLTRAQDTAISFTDVIAFMASAATIARGRSDLLAAEATTFYSFPPGPKVTHALAFLYDPAGHVGLPSGAGGLRPLGLALLAAIAVLMGSAVREAAAELPPRWSRTLATLAPAALLSSERVVFIAHLNGSHAPVAAALLLLALVLLTLHRRPGDVSVTGARWAAGLMVALVVLHRWEALVVVPLVLLPAYRLDVDRRVLVGLWQVLGLTLAAWSFVALQPFRRAEVVVSWAGDPVRSLTIMLAGGLVIYVAGTASRSLSDRVLAKAPALGAAGIGIGVAAYAALSQNGLTRSLSATAANLLPLGGPAAGGWRWSGIAFVGLAAVVLVGRLRDRRPELGMFAYPALMFFPAMLIAAFVREGAYRVGFPDSLNRSWLHVLPLLLVAAAKLTARSASDAELAPSQSSATG